MGLHTAGTRVGEWRPYAAPFAGRALHLQAAGRPTVSDLVFADIVAAHRAVEAMTENYPLGIVTA